MKRIICLPLCLFPSIASAELLYGGYGPDPTNVLIFLAIVFAGYLGSKLLSILQPGLSFSGLLKPITGIAGGFAGMFLVIRFFDAIGTRPEKWFGVTVVLIFAVICGYIFTAILGKMKKAKKSSGQ
jgi:hypothetical protein